MLVFFAWEKNKVKIQRYHWESKMDYCIICLSNKNTKDNTFVLNPSLDAFEKLLVRAGEWHNYKDSELTEFNARTKSITARESFDQRAQYHSSCYKSIANIEKVQRAKKRYSDSIEIGAFY